MAERGDSGVFLEKRSYRRRRLQDASRLLPFLAAWIFLLPIFWPEADAVDPMPLSSVLYFTFAAWFVLIVICAILLRAHGGNGSPSAADPPEPGHSVSPAQPENDPEPAPQTRPAEPSASQEGTAP